MHVNLIGFIKNCIVCKKDIVGSCRDSAISNHSNSAIATIATVATIAAVAATATVTVAATVRRCPGRTSYLLGQFFCKTNLITETPNIFFGKVQK